MVSTTKKHRSKIQGYLSNPYMSDHYSVAELEYTILALNAILKDLHEIKMQKMRNQTQTKQSTSTKIQNKEKKMQKLFTIKDIKGNAYSPPMAHATTGHAERFLQELVTDPQSTVGKYPEDFSLHQIGEFNEETAEIKSMPPMLILEAIIFKKT